MAKLVWRVRLVAELEPGVVSETELARIVRDEQAGLAELGLSLAEAKQLTAALQAQIVPGTDGCLGRVPPRVRGVRTQAGQQGLLPGAVPLPVRRRAGAGPALARLPVPKRGQTEECYRSRPRQRCRGSP